MLPFLDVNSKSSALLYVLLLCPIETFFKRLYMSLDEPNYSQSCLQSAKTLGNTWRYILSPQCFSSTRCQTRYGCPFQLF